MRLCQDQGQRAYLCMVSLAYQSHILTTSLLWTSLWRMWMSHREWHPAAGQPRRANHYQQWASCHWRLSSPGPGLRPWRNCKCFHHLFLRDPSLKRTRANFGFFSNTKVDSDQLKPAGSFNTQADKDFFAHRRGRCGTASSGSRMVRPKLSI